MWREMIAAGGADALRASDRSALIRAICALRDPLIERFGPFRDWSFARRSVSRDEFLTFGTIDPRENPPMLFGEMAEDAKQESPPDTRAAVEAIVDQIGRGAKWAGTPIAAVDAATRRPRIIEGYKRLTAATWAGVPAVEMYFCAPSPALLWPSS